MDLTTLYTLLIAIYGMQSSVDVLYNHSKENVHGTYRHCMFGATNYSSISKLVILQLNPHLMHNVARPLLYSGTSIMWSLYIEHPPLY